MKLLDVEGARAPMPHSWRRHWLQFTFSIVQHRYVWWSSKNSHKSWRSIIHCCWIKFLEQPTSPLTSFLTFCRGVPPGAEDRT